MYKHYLLRHLLIFGITTTCNAMRPFDLLAECFIKIQHPHIQKFASLIKEDQYLLCHDYAFLTAMSAQGEFPFIRGSDWYDTYDVLNACFKKTTYPQPGNIVTYQSNQSTNILHTGIIYDDTKYVVSKWGPRVPHLFLHKIEDVLSIYGNCITFYKPTKTPQEMRDYIQQKYKQISKSNTVENKQKIAFQRYSSFQQEELRFYILTITIIGLWLYNQ